VVIDFAAKVLGESVLIALRGEDRRARGLAIACTA
jgi:hypothetical protein